MNRYVSLVVLAAGAVLLLSAIGASEDAASGRSHLFTDTPTDTTAWLLAAGFILTLVGLGGVLRSRGS